VPCRCVRFHHRALLSPQSHPQSLVDFYLKNLTPFQNDPAALEEMHAATQSVRGRKTTPSRAKPKSKTAVPEEEEESIEEHVAAMNDLQLRSSLQHLGMCMVTRSEAPSAHRVRDLDRRSHHRASPDVSCALPSPLSPCRSTAAGSGLAAAPASPLPGGLLAQVSRLAQSSPARAPCTRRSTYICCLPPNRRCP